MESYHNMVMVIVLLGTIVVAVVVGVVVFAGVSIFAY